MKTNLIDWSILVVQLIVGAVWFLYFPTPPRITATVLAVACLALVIKLAIGILAVCGPGGAYGSVGDGNMFRGKVNNANWFLPIFISFAIFLKTIWS